MKINTISAMGVNCYLVQNGEQYFLVDTGFRFSRKKIEAKMIAAGCKPGQLKLILLTHADGDHAGNAVYFKQKYGAQIAMHPAENKAAASGNLLKSRSHTSPTLRWILTALLPIVGLSKADRFSSDIELADDRDLSYLGLDVRVYWLPGHSSGSIAFLLSDGSLFCGDLLTNLDQPGLNSNLDDVQAGKLSLKRLLKIPGQMIFPGHGTPFPVELLQP
jgi:hydroxyacylglutathione hydrolase